MTHVPATSAASTAAIAAAAAARAAKMRDEEENMTSYNKNDLDGWEFKIVRSNLGRFGKYEKVKEVCEQEARAGWELVEKFDDYRLRFKRPVHMRSKDQFLDFDPYRTSVSSGGGALALIIIGIVILLAGLVTFAAVYFSRHHIRIEPAGIAMIIVAVGILVTLIAFIVSRVGRKTTGVR